MIQLLLLGLAVFKIVLCQVAIKARTNTKNKTPWTLPILTSNFFDESLTYSNQYTKKSSVNVTALPKILIPRILWISFRKVPIKDDDIHPHIKELLTRAKSEGWTVHLVGEKEQLDFLAKYYPNTSLLWAVNAIHADAGVCQSDIWRYAALYKFGGVYLDDDSFIGKSLERDCINADNEMILTIEKNKFANHCYRRAFYLNHDHLFRSEGDHFDYSSVYGGKVLANWGIMTKPHHPILLKTLENIVEIIRREYLRLPAIFMLPTEPRWKAVHCATGPMLFTSSVFETMQRDNIAFINTTYLRVSNKDFQEFDGVFKVSYEEKYMPHTHYMVKMNQRNTPLLHTYLPLSQSLLTLQLNNTPIMEGGRGIYMIVDGQKRVFPNMDTFYAFGVQVNDIMTFQSHSEFSSIPDGPPIITPASPLPPPVLPPIMAGSHAANLALQVSNAVTSVPVASSFQPSIAVKTSQTISISSQTPTVAPILAPIANPSFPSMAFVTVTQSVGSAEVYFVQSDLLRKVPDTFTATRLGYEEAVATSSTVTYSATDFQSLVSNRTYEIGAPVPTLLFAVGNADEGILAELRRIHLLYNHTLIFSAHKFGPYFNPSIYPLDLLTSAADGSRTQSVRTENVKSVNGGLAASLSRTKGNRGSVRKEKYSNLMIHRGLLWKDPQTYITVADESLTRVRILTEKSKTDEARWAAWTWDAEDRAVKTSTEGSSYVDNGELMYKAEDVRVIAPPAQTHIQLSPLQFGLGSSIRALLVYTKVLSSVRKQTFGHIELSVLSLNDTTHTFQLSPPVALEITKEINEEELSVEKNWSPFDYQGSLYFIYRFMPFIVIKVGSFNSSINIGTMELVSTTHCLTRAHATLAGDGANLPTGHVHAHHGLRQWEYGTVRGGTPALLVRDEYYLTFFHSKKAIQQELGVKRPETYFMGAYIFSAHPPFRVLRISRVPIALDEFYDGQWCQSPPIDYVVYPMSFYFSTPAGELIESSRADNTSVIVLSMGRNDIHGWSVKIRLVDLEHSLVPHHC